MKRLLERKWRKTRSTVDRSAYRKQVNLVNKIMYKGKCKFYTELIQDNQSDPRSLWKQLNSVFHLLPVSVLPKDSSNSNLANRFSSFFIEKIRNIRSGFPSLSPHVTSHKDIPAFPIFTGFLLMTLRK